MANEKQITTVAYRLDPSRKKLSISFNVLQFPEAWKPQLLGLQKEGNASKNGKNRIPIWSLNATLRALVPDLVAINGNADYSGPKDWLIANKPIDPNALFLIVRAWAKATYSELPEATRKKWLASLKASDLKWTSSEIDVAKNGTLASGTSDPNSNTYNVLPNHLAGCFQNSLSPIMCGGEALNLRRMATSASTSGAELISWPPIRGGSEKYYGYFSYRIFLSVQTVAFDEDPILYAHVGVRRWVTFPNSRLPSGNTSVAILTEVPWIKGLNNSNSLQRASVRWEHLGPGQFRLKWTDRLADILGILKTNPLVDPNELRANPENWFNNQSDTALGIVYSESVTPTHAVGAGVSADERKKVVQQLDSILATQGFAPAAELTQVPNVPSIYNPFFVNTPTKKKDDSDQQHKKRLAAFSKKVLHQRVVAVGQTCQKRLDLEIHYQTVEARNAMVHALQKMLGMPVSNKLKNGQLTWLTEDLHLTLNAIQIGAIGDSLKLPIGHSNKADRIESAIRARIEEVRQEIETPKDNVCAAIVELPNSDAFNKDDDPKTALRLAFASTNRITQFMTPRVKKKNGKIETDEGMLHRARASWRDLFRQLGVSLEMPVGNFMSAKSPGRILGLWLIKSTKANNQTAQSGFLPVAVCMDTKERIIYAKVNGIDRLQTYPEALISLGRGQGTFVKDEKAAGPFIKNMLDELNGAGDSLVLCNKHNLGKAWPWLNNNRIHKDQISFGYDSALTPVTDFAGVRIVRVRGGSATFETPQWYSVVDDETKLPKGLWKMSDRVFGSTYGKPAQAKDASQYTSKVGPWTNSRGRSFPAQPKKHLPNPAFYELTAACLQPDDDPSDWVALAHMLRKGATHYGDAVARPYPLLLAERMLEYTFPTKTPHLDVGTKDRKNSQMLFSGL